MESRAQPFDQQLSQLPRQHQQSQIVIGASDVMLDKQITRLTQLLSAPPRHLLPVTS
jgi:hypothetical protein